jgi:hypothetical protein
VRAREVTEGSVGVMGPVGVGTAEDVVLGVGLVVVALGVVDVVLGLGVRVALGVGRGVLLSVGDGVDELGATGAGGGRTSR